MIRHGKLSDSVRKGSSVLISSTSCVRSSKIATSAAVHRGISGQGGLEARRLGDDRPSRGSPHRDVLDAPAGTRGEGGGSWSISNGPWKRNSVSRTRAWSPALPRRVLPCGTRARRRCSRAEQSPQALDGRRRCPPTPPDPHGRHGCRAIFVARAPQLRPGRFEARPRANGVALPSACRPPPHGSRGRTTKRQPRGLSGRRRSGCPSRGRSRTSALRPSPRRDGGRWRARGPCRKTPPGCAWG